MILYTSRTCRKTIKQSGEQLFLVTNSIKFILTKEDECHVMIRNVKIRNINTDNKSTDLKAILSKSHFCDE